MPPLRNSPMTELEQTMIEQVSVQLLIAREYLAQDKPVHIRRAQAHLIRTMLMPAVDVLLEELEAE